MNVAKIKEKYVYCKNCNEEVTFTAKPEKLKTYDGFEYSGFIPYCDKCGNKVKSSNVEDVNLRNLWNAYHRK